MTQTLVESTVDPRQVEEFSGRLFQLYTGSLLTYMIDIGHRTGLFETLARGAGTSADVAARAGLEERYVREWLAALTTGGIVEHDAATATFSLPAERAAALTEGPTNLAQMAQFSTHLGKHVHQVARAFSEGGGVPYAEYRPEFTDVMDAASRSIYDGHLVQDYCDLVPGLRDRLRAGIRVADVCCGTGHALVLLARAFPASTFTGFDIDDGAIARARAEAGGAGLRNVTFEVCDAARLRVDKRFDVAFVFDAVHDQVDPAAVLTAVHDLLAPDGVLLMKEPHAADTLEENRANPMAPLLYSVSTLHCLTVSLAHGGAGIGTVFGEGHARRLLADAGFRDVDVVTAPGDPPDAVYIAHA